MKKILTALVAFVVASCAPAYAEVSTITLRFWRTLQSRGPKAQIEVRIVAP